MPYLAATERSMRLDVIISRLHMLEKDAAVVVEHPLARERLLNQIRPLMDSLHEQRAAFSD